MSQHIVRFSNAPDESPQNSMDRRRLELATAINVAIDVDKLQAVLERLIVLGLPKQQALCFLEMTGSVRALIKTENNRIHKF